MTLQQLEETTKDIIHGKYATQDVGLRYWGKYEQPFTFNIYVNKMEDVLKHDRRNNK